MQHSIIVLGSIMPCEVMASTATLTFRSVERCNAYQSKANGTEFDCKIFIFSTLSLRRYEIDRVNQVTCDIPPAPADLYLLAVQMINVNI